MHAGEEIGLTWVVCKEAKGKPTTSRNTSGVPLNRVHQIKLGRVFAGIIVPEALSNNKEIESVKMERMRLGSKCARVLQHHLHARVVRQHQRPCPVAHRGVVRRRSRVVVRRPRVRREVGGVNPVGLSVEVRLEEGRRGERKGDVVHLSCELLAIGSLTRGVRRARGRSEPDGEKEPPVYGTRNIGRKLVAGQAAELRGQAGDELGDVGEFGGVEGRERRSEKGQIAERIIVMNIRA